MPSHVVSYTSSLHNNTQLHIKARTLVSDKRQRNTPHFKHTQHNISSSFSMQCNAVVTIVLASVSYTTSECNKQRAIAMQTTGATRVDAARQTQSAGSRPPSPGGALGSTGGPNRGTRCWLCPPPDSAPRQDLAREGLDHHRVAAEASQRVGALLRSTRVQAGRKSDSWDSLTSPPAEESSQTQRLKVVHSKCEAIDSRDLNPGAIHQVISHSICLNHTSRI